MFTRKALCHTNKVRGFEIWQITLFWILSLTLKVVLVQTNGLISLNFGLYMNHPVEFKSTVPEAK